MHASHPDRTAAINSGVPPLRLPFSRTPAPESAFHPESVPVALSGEIAQKLLSPAPEPETAFLTGWLVLLWRYADQAEIVMGVVKQGFCFPVTIVLKDQHSFSDLMNVVNAELAKAEHEAPAAEGGEALCAMFCMERALRSDWPANKRLRFQIMLRICTDETKCSAELLYDPAAIPRHSVERMSRSLATLLAAAARNPASPASALPILNEEDWNQVVVGFNQTAAPYPAHKCIHQLIEEQVKRTPERVALRDRQQALSYQQLNARANRLAHFLRREGAKPNLPVALYIDRCAEMIIGLLAILKAGAPYLPLIPTDPPARVARQLADTRPEIIVTTQAFAPSVNSGERKIVFIDQDYEHESPENPNPVTGADDLVYVLFTSGSTGSPKGVAICHRNVVNYTHFICGELGVDRSSEGWHFATVSTLAADLGNTSIFGALTSGGCLHVIDYETAMTPALFEAYAAEHPIDLLKIAPSHLAALLRETHGGAILPRRFLVVGGEKLTWELLREIRSRGTCAVMNHCGPTETTIGCCTLIVNERAFAGWGPATVPLGRPIANDQIYILDRRMQPVPVGVIGELYMSGAGLSCGYYNRPELTAERFLAHPFSSNRAERAYRTGDLGRFLPDGSIEFLGRVDHQVKIRGFRVEPSELEIALRRYPGVKDAVVAVEQSENGERMLVAYVASTKAKDEKSLREFAAQFVPDYMLPARVVVLEKLPLNANGKIDLQALAELARNTPAATGHYVGPRTPDEEKLAAIWQEVLRIERVSIDENFFVLGGHSLLATRIIARIRKVFEVNFPLSAFLQNPTIEASAAALAHYGRLPRNEDEELARVIHDLSGLSEEEAERLLAEMEE